MESAKREVSVAVKQNAALVDESFGDWPRHPSRGRGACRRSNHFCRRGWVSQEWFSTGSGLPQALGKAVDDGRGAGEKADGREENDVVLGVEVAGLGDDLRADVVVGDAEIVERDAPPAFGLRAEPGVDEGYACGAHWMRLDAGHGGDGRGLQTEVGDGVVQLGACGVANKK